MPRITALPSLAAMGDTVVVPVDDNGVTKKITGAALKTYTAPAAGSITNTMLAGNIANAKLLNSSATIGTSLLNLGATIANIEGLNLVSATTLSGTLNGAAPANLLSGTTLKSTVVTSSLTSVGTLTGLSVTTTTVGNSVNITYNPPTASGAAIQATGKDSQGGTGYFDFFKATNTTSGVSNANKTFRLNSTGSIEIINSAYSATILSLSDAGGLSVPGPISISGKQAVNGPAFSAYAAAILQTISNATLTKVLFQTEEFDTNSNYASSRFTPTVEGYYQLNAEVRLDGASGTGEMMIVLYKNGTAYKRGTNQQGTQIAANFWAMQVSSVVYANGTTDYFEIYVQQGSGGTVSVTAVNDPSITWFNGCMIRGA